MSDMSADIIAFIPRRSSPPADPFEHTCHTETHPAYPDRADYLAAWQGSDMFSELVISLIILNPGPSVCLRCLFA